MQTLSLQRQMMENLIIAKARQDAVSFEYGKQLDLLHGALMFVAIQMQKTKDVYKFWATIPALMLALCSNANEVGGALLGIGPGEERMVKAEKDIKHWISDLGMLIFFFYVYPLAE